MGEFSKTRQSKILNKNYKYLSFERSFNILHVASSSPLGQSFTPSQIKSCVMQVSFPFVLSTKKTMINSLQLRLFVRKTASMYGFLGYNIGLHL